MTVSKPRNLEPNYKKTKCGLLFAASYRKQHFISITEPCATRFTNNEKRHTAVFLNELPIAKIVNKFSPFVKGKGLLSQPQQPVSGLNPMPH
jgi:hypothetical protein